MTDDDPPPIAVPDRVELSVEVEQDGGAMEIEIEIEIGWRGGPVAT